jgi:hypothetical protein
LSDTHFLLTKAWNSSTKAPTFEYSNHSGDNMDSRRNRRVSIFDAMVLTGIGLGIVYWIIETIYDVLTIDGVGFLGGLFGGGLSGIGMRIIVICLFIIFGAHAQYNINKRKQAESELADLRSKVEQLKTDIAASKKK